jgi:hypothetical protein
MMPSSLGLNSHRIKFPIPQPLPSLSISADRKNKILLQERAQFMEKLARERVERGQLESWGATKVQTIFRGFMIRPKPKKVFRVPEAMTRETIQQQLQMLTSEMDRQLEVEMQQSDDKTPEWRRSIQRRAAGKKHMHRMKEIGHAAAVMIQAVIRGFVARRAVRLLWSRQEDEMRTWAALRLQSIQRGFHIRAINFTQKIKSRHMAAIMIQSLAKGMLDREYVNVLRKLIRETQREDSAAVRIQAIFRKRHAERDMDDARQNAAACKLQEAGRDFFRRKRVKRQKPGGD